MKASKRREGCGDQIRVELPEFEYDCGEVGRELCEKCTQRYEVAYAETAEKRKGLRTGFSMIDQSYHYKEREEDENTSTTE